MIGGKHQIPRAYFFQSTYFVLNALSLLPYPCCRLFLGLKMTAQTFADQAVSLLNVYSCLNKLSSFLGQIVRNQCCH